MIHPCICTFSDVSFRNGMIINNLLTLGMVSLSA